MFMLVCLAEVLHSLMACSCTLTGLIPAHSKMHIMSDRGLSDAVLCRLAEARQQAGHMAIDAALHAELRRLAGSAAPAYAPAQLALHPHVLAAARQPVANAVAARMMDTPSPPSVARVPLTVSGLQHPGPTRSGECGCLDAEHGE